MYTNKEEINSNMQILCIIPARSGSKGVPNKNIKLIANKPLINWTIEQAKQSEYYINGCMRIIVSTDSEEYKTVVLNAGAEVPFLRPKDISLDKFEEFRGSITKAIYDCTMEFNGSICAEHGVGILKKADLFNYKSDLEINLMRSIKHSIDPLNIMNPGKVI